MPSLSLLQTTGDLAPSPREHYRDHMFTVPAGASRVHVRFAFHKERLAQLFISLWGPDGFRGNRMNPGARGDVTLQLWTAPDDASDGAVPGPLTPGVWRVQIDIEALGEDVTYTLAVTAEMGEAGPPAPAFPATAPTTVRAEAGWYRGELHAHSTESDGKHAVATVIEAAIDTALDFFALTDHFTHSQWRKLAPYDKHIALLRSLEVTSHQGHANLHGLREWVDVYVDRADWSMNAAAAATRAQGGLFCVNHAYSGRLGWQAYDFDWHNADLMEIYHHLEGPNNPYQVALWDQKLAAGYRVVGVAGTDSHDPFEGMHRLGQVVTWVHADALSERGIIDGLRRGRVYVSRGPQVRFSAHNGEHSAHMWQTLHTPGPVNLRLAVWADEPLRVLVLKDGLNLDTAVIEPAADWQHLAFVDTPTAPCYYRVELHALPAETDPFRYIQRRDHTTVRALTNPVWVAPAPQTSVSDRT